VARHPDLRWRLRPKDISRLAARQSALLASLASLVRPGGLLVYAVCSVEPEENEGVTGPFLAEHPDFAAEPLPEWAAPFAEGDHVRMRPEAHRGDCFFAARWRRTGDAAPDPRL